MYYIVLRPFRDKSGFIAGGTVITDPTSIYTFRSRYKEGTIVDLTEQNYKKYYHYFVRNFADKTLSIERASEFIEYLIKENSPHKKEETHIETEEADKVEESTVETEEADKVEATEEKNINNEETTEEAKPNDKPVAKPVVAAVIK